MRHDPASGAIIVMLRSLKMHGMAQAVTDLMEQGAPAFDAAIPILSQLLKAETAVNGHRRFRKSGHLKFPSLAGGFVSVISRDGDRAFPLLAGGRAVSARAVG